LFIGFLTAIVKRWNLGISQSENVVAAAADDDSGDDGVLILNTTPSYSHWFSVTYSK